MKAPSCDVRRLRPNETALSSNVLLLFWSGDLFCDTVLAQLDTNTWNKQLCLKCLPDLLSHEKLPAAVKLELGRKKNYA